MKSNVFQNHAGKKFGLWTAIKYLGDRKWKCVCECGTEKNLFTVALTRGMSKSCGCNKSKLISENRPSHGHSAIRTKTYRSWDAMIQRCTNENNNRFHRYGGLGVTVCDRWIHSFENFLEDMGESKAGLSLDRINPFGNYEPNNCRWATAKEQANNRRSNYAQQGVKFSAPKWMDEVAERK